MAVLRDLPYDVKHCILTHLSDRASLAALVGTCTAFRDIYTRHKNTILRRIHHAEATALAPDSLIFAYCLRAIPSIATMATLVGFVKDYETYHSTGVPPTCISTGLIEEPSAYDPSKLANYLVDDYRGIRTIALAHQFPMRESRQEPPLSCTEIRRIMRALYRGWTLMLLLHAQQRLRISDPPPTYGSDSRSYDDYDPNFIERMVLKCWDVWSVLQIRIVMDDSLRMLPSGGPDANDSQALMEFGAQMQRSLVYQIVAPSGDGPGETLIPVLLTPAFQYVDTKAPRSGLNLLLTPGFAGYLFTNCHPATIAPLFTLDPLSGARAAFDRLATVLADQLQNAPVVVGAGYFAEKYDDAVGAAIFGASPF
ncbi:hypothetical protein DRE_05242 [Drechslerella stenobrocha 248]|uniref:F-box domain-containing protein n=1 Tax=Drechslerella stenobrocha 248 TaxID=1043628 RepID=W7HNP0_9PEZI|nr:hypothetical protein DRE_05242 [Drechslerella stenobrocha 248]